MGIVVHYYVSPYSFVMGALWFGVFVLLGLLMRRLRFPITFSVIPLIVLLALGISRMFIFIEIPGAVVMFSERLYPAIINIARFQIISVFTVSHILVFVWVAVAVFLGLRYLDNYIRKYRPIMNWLASSPRDHRSEKFLAKIVGPNKHLRIFRNKALSTAVATPYRPHIILPVVKLSTPQLRTILLHEWKHIRDKDYLTRIIMDLICCAFWWNPFVYVLKRNFHFARELKCDQFAVNSDNDFNSLLTGVAALYELEQEKRKNLVNIEGFSQFAGKRSVLQERLEVLRMKEFSRGKRIIANIGYSSIAIVLFAFSYSFTILPMHRAPYDTVTTDEFFGESIEVGDVFRATEQFLFKNEDGTFSLYMDGQFVTYVDTDHDMIKWMPIGERE